MVSGSDSKIISDNCVFSDCGILFIFQYNSSGIVNNCHMNDMECVAWLEHNVKGKIMFQNNHAVNSTTLFKDPVSIRPDHDFDDCTIQMLSDQDVAQELNKLPTAKEQSTYTKIQHETMRTTELTPAITLARLGPRMKMCNRCKMVELPAKGKMKFCKKCKKVCYCSKECQEADWVDHKLVCRTLQSMR